MKFSISLFSILFTTLSIGQSYDSANLEVYNLYDHIEKTNRSGFYKVKHKGKLGIIDSTGQVIVPPIYDQIKDQDYSSSSYAAGIIFLDKGDSTYVFNTDYQQLMPYAFDFYCPNGADSILVVGKEQQIGVFQKGKGLVIPIKYEDLVSKNGFFFLKTTDNRIELHDLSKEQTKMDFEVVEINSDLFGANRSQYMDYGLLFLAEKNGEYGVFHAGIKGTIVNVVDFQYEREDIYLNRDHVYLREQKQWYVARFKDDFKKRAVDNVELLKKGIFESYYEVVSKGDRYGVINYLGQFIIPAKYDRIALLKLGYKDCFAVEKGSKKALFSKDGEQLTRFSFETMTRFKQDYILVSLANKYGVIAADGNQIIPMEYDNIFDARTAYFAVLKENKIGLIDKTGKVLFAPQFSRKVFITDDSASYFAYSFQHYLNDQEHIIAVNRTGKELVPALYDELVYTHTSWQKTRYDHQLFLVKKNGLYGVISETKELISPRYEKINDYYFYSDSIVPFTREGKSGYLNLNSLKEQFYGDYDLCMAFEKDYAFVKKANKYGLIDRFGSEMLAPVYESIVKLETGVRGANHLLTVEEQTRQLQSDPSPKSKIGVYNTRLKRFVIPAAYDRIKIVSGNSDYYSAYDLHLNSTALFDIKGDGEPLFIIAENSKSLQYSPSSAERQAYFKIYKDNQESDYYDLDGKRVILKDPKNRARAPEEFRIPPKETPYELLKAKYEQLYRVSGTHYPKIFAVQVIYKAKKGGKNGLITEDETIIIPFIYDKLESIYDGFLQAEKDGQLGWLSRTGEVILPIEYESIERIESYIPDFYLDSLFHLKREGKNGVASVNGNILIPAIYDELRLDFSGILFKLAIAKAKSEIYTGQISHRSFNICGGDYDLKQEHANALKADTLGFYQQKKLISQNFLIPAKKNETWGLLNLEGETILPFEYDSITMRTGLMAQLEKDNQITFYDFVNKQALPFVCDTVFEQLDQFSYTNSRRHYQTMIFAFRSNGKYGLLNFLTRQYLPPVYESIEQCFKLSWHRGGLSFFTEDGLFDAYMPANGNTDINESTDVVRFKSGNQYGLINIKELKQITAQLYEQIKVETTDEISPIILTLDNKMTFLLPEKCTIANALFDSVSILSGDPYLINRHTNESDRTAYFKVLESGLHGVYDHNGALVVPMDYQNVIFMLIIGDKVSDQFIVQKNGKFGIVGRNGVVLVPIIHDEIRFNADSNFSLHYEFLNNGVRTYKHYDSF